MEGHSDGVMAQQLNISIGHQVNPMITQASSNVKCIIDKIVPLSILESTTNGMTKSAHLRVHSFAIHRRGQVIQSEHFKSAQLLMSERLLQ